MSSHSDATAPSKGSFDGDASDEDGKEGNDVITDSPTDETGANPNDTLPPTNADESMSFKNHEMERVVLFNTT